MRTVRGLWLMGILPLVLIGCSGSSNDKPAPPPTLSPQEQQARIEANLAQLSPEDRKLAEEQQYCPHMKEQRLGAAGVPIKVMVNGQPVFVCCRGCQRQAAADPDKTLEAVKELKGKGGSPATKR